MWHMLLAAALLFPNVHARDLDGRAIETNSLRGAPVVYLLGFSYDSRFEVEAWARFIKALPTPPRTIQMPVYGGFAAFARPMIDNSMARNTPASVHRDVLTTTDRDVLVRGLSLVGPEREAAVVLVNREGQVTAIERGKPSAASQADFSAALKRL
jgi:hypothetical protein